MCGYGFSRNGQIEGIHLYLDFLRLSDQVARGIPCEGLQGRYSS